MLFLLTKERGNSYYLISNEEYTIGRKKTDILIEDDVSISRTHAIIKIQENSAVIIDNGSKYSTTLNENKLIKNIETPLKNGDTIKFGRFGSVYSLHQVMINTTCSGLNKDEKQSLVKILDHFGGKLSNEWSEDCTHLTVEGITLTIKYLHALISGKPVVTIKYWKKLIDSAKSKLEAPKIDDFKPPMAETILMGREINSNPHRRDLFKNKIFIFPDEKNQRMIKDLIEKCGGTSMSWKEDPIQNLDVINSLDKYIFIKCDNAKISNDLETVYKKIQKFGRRIIPLQEIAFAIFTCSCHKDCNPNFNIVESVFKNEKNISHVNIVLETQSQNEIIEPKTEKIIPESVEPGFDDILPASYKVEPEDVLVVEKLEIMNEEDVKQDYSHKRPNTEDSLQQNKKPRSESSSLQRTPQVHNKTLPQNLENNISNVHSQNSRVFADANQNILQIASSSNYSNNATTSTSEIKKRKAETALFAPPVKKPAKNPLPVLMNRTSKPFKKENPFSRLRIKTEIFENDNDNLFLRSSQSSQESIEKSLSSDENNSRKSFASGTKVSSTGWLKKDEISQDSVVKIDNELFQKLYDRFRDIVVIGTNDYRKKEFTNNSINIMNNSVNGKKNFKQFRKVLPLKPQTTIVNVSSTAPNPNIDSSLAERFQVNDDDDNEEEIIRPVVVARRSNKTVSKKFDF